MSTSPRASQDVVDIWEAEWIIDEVRLTDHGWSLVLGRPASGGRHGRTTVMTQQLHDYLIALRADPGAIRLPLGATAIKRLRSLLGLNWYDDNEQWWIDRLDDLRTLSSPDFCARHRVKDAAVYAAKRKLIGPGQRDAYWHRDPTVAALILSHSPRAVVAAKLDISIAHLASLRADLRREAGEDMSPPAIARRISKSKTGVPRGDRDGRAST